MGVTLLGRGWARIGMLGRVVTVVVAAFVFVSILIGAFSGTYAVVMGTGAGIAVAAIALEAYVVIRRSRAAEPSAIEIHGQPAPPRRHDV